MNIPPDLVQFLGSLVAILLTGLLAYWLRLGPPPLLENEDEALVAAEAAMPSFEPTEVALDRDGRGALFRDRAGRILVLKPHGSHFAARVLATGARAEQLDDGLLISTGERRFGGVKLRLQDASAWARAVEATRTQGHA